MTRTRKMPTAGWPVRLRFCVAGQGWAQIGASDYFRLLSAATAPPTSR